MTWYADEILLSTSPKAMEYLTHDPILHPFSYWVKNLDTYEWYAPEHRHTLSTNGLLAISPVTAPDSHSLSWYDMPILDWTTVERTQSPSSIALIEELGDVSLETLPPLSFRCFLRDLATACDQPVLYYSCSMWGGSIEQEYCLAYASTESLFITSPDEMLQPEVTVDKRYEVESALQSGLSVIGLDIPTGFFAPHTRSFPWKNHKL